jgi:hypothetical protein
MIRPTTIKNNAPRLAAIHKGENTQTQAQSITLVSFSIRNVTQRIVTIPTPPLEL